MNIYQIVLDTNVLVTGLQSNKGASYQLLSILNDERFQLNISPTLIVEYEDVLKRKNENLGLTYKDIDDVIDFICSIANHHQIYYLWRPLSTDPNDDFIIDLALKAQCNYIISYNKKHLKNIIKLGVDILTPKEFLQLLGKI
ncbi:PilT protein domain protein [Cyanobacterium stanieri PCC 7202]|uniref:PilT protein domain protein n=1 Tax=Cyanobacterium stanieri (strain ATCC 29140 / PCC 7202) TaxID=292563 RepID=K9YIE3_CYASC|nr:PilT protein domain protein [Cyanobacterium stanieri PCC 7202]